MMPQDSAGPRSGRMQPLWARVDSNRAKLAAFVVLFIFGSAALLSLAMVAVPGAIVGAVVHQPDDAYWMWYSAAVATAMLGLLLIGTIIAAVQLSNAEDWVRGRFNGRALRSKEAPVLESVVADMSLAAGLSGPPAILVLDDPGENAFALGTARKRATIGITRGMLDGFTTEEMRAVVATLVARIVSGDILFATAMAALMGPIKAIRESRKSAGDAATGVGTTGCGDPGCTTGCGNGCGGDGCLDVGSGDDIVGGLVIVLFIALVVAVTYLAVLVAAWIVTLWGRALNRTSYEKADAEGMLLLKNPAPMLDALRKAIRSANLVAEGDQSYDGIFYASTSGTPRIEKAERRRFERLAEVLGVEGLAANLDGPLSISRGTSADETRDQR